jgi:hypothetical protein
LDIAIAIPDALGRANSIGFDDVGQQRLLLDIGIGPDLGFKNMRGWALTPGDKFNRDGIGRCPSGLTMKRRFTEPEPHSISDRPCPID